jgi:hypothetical protein
VTFSGLILDDPAELSRLVVGELPRFPDECRLRDRRPSIDLLWEVLGMKLWGVRRLIVCHGFFLHEKAPVTPFQRLIEFRVVWLTPDGLALPTILALVIHA